MPNWNGAAAELERSQGGPRPDGAERWRARLPDGSEAAALVRHFWDAAAAIDAGERMRRLHGRPHQALEPVLGWAVEAEAAWMLTDVPGGVSLARLLSATTPSPAQSVAIGSAVLAGLDALHAAGLSHGGLSKDSTWIAADGRARVTGQAFSGLTRPSPTDLKNDIKDAGAVVCAALGIETEPIAGARMRTAERAAPAVCATARAIANGAMGANAARAREAFKETAASLGSNDRLALVMMELAAAVRQLPSAAPASPPTIGAAVEPPRRRPEPAPVPPPATAVEAPQPVPPLAPAPPPTPHPPLAPAPAAPSALAPPMPPASPVAARPDVDRRVEAALSRAGRGRAGAGGGSRRLLPIVVALGAFLIAGGLGAYVVSSLASRSQGAPTAATVTPAPSGAPTAAPTASNRPAPSVSPVATQAVGGPKPVPTYAPAASGTVKEVDLARSGDCSAGGACTVTVDVFLTAVAPAAEDVQWKFEVFNPCTGSSAEPGTGHFTMQQGWNHISSDSSFTMPSAAGALDVVAVTTAPNVAASKPLLIGSGGC